MDPRHTLFCLEKVNGPPSVQHDSLHKAYQGVTLTVELTITYIKITWPHCNEIKKKGLGCLWEAGR